MCIAEKSDPPVCKIVDYGKMRYEQERKKKDQKKKAKTNEIKEVKMSYKIGEGDYQVRRRAATKFIKNGNRVKLAIQRGRRAASFFSSFFRARRVFARRFRGREQQHISLGDELIEKFINHLTEDGANIAKTKTVREGRDLTTILSQKS